MNPYYVKAQETCEVGPFNYDAEHWSEASDQPELPLGDSRLLTSIYQSSAPPTRFGSRYREDIDQAGDIRALLHANVTQIHRDPLSQTVQHVTTRTLEGKTLTVNSRLFVIATGGMENPRLLLLNDIGNQHDQVGRYFMEHIGIPKATLLLAKDVNTLFYKRTSINGTDIRAGLSLRPEVIKKEQILNTWIGFQLKATPQSRLAHSVDTLKSSIMNGDIPDDFVHHLKTVLRSMRQIYRDRDPAESDDDELGGTGELVEIPVGQQSEQSPNPLSRVTLGDQLDALGQRKIVFDWRLTELDYYSIRRTQEITAAEIGKSDLGRMKIPNPKEPEVWQHPQRISELAQPQGAFHHMGTTRMSTDPQHGVVDSDCKVHGTKNLYMAGSSVFPTCGYQNPTLTIVAMAHRLAEHLAAQFPEQEPT